MEVVKYLGVLLDSSLTWQPHISSIVGKVSSSCHALFLARQCFPLHVTRQLYFSLVESHLGYCLTSWGNTYPTYLDRLFKLQKRALRLITFAHRRSSSADIFLKLNVMPLPDLVRLKYLCMIHSIVNNVASIDASGFRYCSRSNRSVERFGFIPFRANNVYGCRLLECYGVKLWNALPLSLKTDPRFKTNVRRHVKSSSTCLSFVD